MAKCARTPQIGVRTSAIDMVRGRTLFKIRAGMCSTQAHITICLNMRFIGLNWFNGMSDYGQQRKSRTTILMSVKPPKAEVAGEADTKCVVRLPGDWPLIQLPIMSRQPNAKTAR